MKLHPDPLNGVNAINKLTTDQVVIGTTAYRHPVLVPWIGDVQVWRAQSASTLETEDFLQVLALRPELVIFGSGARLRFPNARLLQPFMAQRIGFESMDAGAACRTYNILAGEGRKVVLALLLANQPERAPCHTTP